MLEWTKRVARMREVIWSRPVAFLVEDKGEESLS